MKAMLKFSFLFCFALPLLATAQDAAPYPWRDLFDGTSLSGFRAAESAASFSVKDGVLVVKGPRGHLFYEGNGQDAAFENFHLEAEVMTFAAANSGIFLHTSFQDSGWPEVGYEIQVNNSHSDTIRTGSIYGVVKVSEPPAKDGEWFRMEILVRRKNVCVKVNGKTLVNWNEPADVTGKRRLSRGTIAVQAHDPGSEIHYRRLRIRELPSDASDLTRAERQLLKPEGEWWDRMDYGPFLSASIGLGRGNVMLKGIAVPLGHEESMHYAFDTELLRAAIWEGTLRKTGVTYDGAHGGHPMRRGSLLLSTENRPGWSRTDSFADPRATPHGPMPHAVGRYQGLHRMGEQVILSYQVGGVEILESPSAVSSSQGLIALRSFEVQPRTEALTLLLAEGQNFTAESPKVFVARPAKPTASHLLDEDRAVVVMDRAESDFESLSMGAPVAGDRVGGRNGAAVFFVDGWSGPHPGAGSRNGDLPRLYDGEAAQNHDDTRRTSWFDGERARLMVRLTDACDVARVHVYTWHRGNRAPQVYRLYGHASPSAGGMEEDLAASGWVAIADVDTKPLGMGGRHGVCIHNPKGILGRYARLLLDLRPAQGGEGPFLTEIDVFAKGDSFPALKSPAFAPPEDPVVRLMLATDDPGLRLETLARDGDVPMTVLRVPPGTKPVRFQLAVDRGQSAVSEALAALPKLTSLSWLLLGGDALYKETITTEASVDASKGASYVVDDIPIPFDNPYQSEMRIGAFDFFSDGDRAALCTWNGDVWVVSGLRGMKTIHWKRFATGLFETLGLKIVNDQIYVNGKDQVTLLQDLNADGEADYYRCFNNDVPITDNFHEFTFDLQTDAAGNFYFSKAAPVLPGGRGFGPIVDSHGTVMKLSKDGKNLRVFARGLRAPNGIGVGPNGEITSGDNEGTWVPHCKLHWMREGSFQGVVDVAEKGTRPTEYNPPLCWFPMEVDNSGGGQVWVTSSSFGPFQGDLLHLSYGQSSIYKVMPQQSGGFMQGAVFRLPVRLASSAMRARFHPVDGQLWVSGLKGWQTNAARLAGFQRVRFTGETFASPKGFEVVEGGLKLSFTVPLDKELATDVESYEISHWNYVWGPQYGSPEVSADEPDEEVLKKALSSEMHRYQKRDTVPVESATLSDDGLSVHLKIPTLKPVMQIRVKLDLESEDNKPMAFDIYGTIHHIPGRK